MKVELQFSVKLIRFALITSVLLLLVIKRWNKTQQKQLWKLLIKGAVDLFLKILNTVSECKENKMKLLVNDGVATWAWVVSKFQFTVVW